MTEEIYELIDKLTRAHSKLSVRVDRLERELEEVRHRSTTQETVAEETMEEEPCEQTKS